MSESARPPGAAPADRPVWGDGRLLRGAAATLSLFDRGARDGEGLFETVRVEGGRAQSWERHLERLVLSAAELGFPVPPAPAELARALEETLAAAGLADAAARLTVTRGIPGGRPTRAGCWIDVEPLAARLWRGTRSGEAAAIVSSAPFEPGPLGRHKTTSRLAYHLARDEARAAGADEALLVSPAGEVLEGSCSNVFTVRDGRIRTPPLARGILPGVMRARVLARCAALGVPVREAAIDRAELERADEVFLTSALQGVVPLATLAGRRLPARDLGRRLLEACRAERVAGGGTASPVPGDPNGR